jgi:hypothetical protein
MNTRPHPLAAFAFALLATLATLGGIGTLAEPETASTAPLAQATPTVRG